MSALVDLRARFWAKVNKLGPTQLHIPGISRCWVWTASQYSNGYGSFKLPKALTGAHRASWVLNRGDIPAGRWVLHRCDNRLCVRPDHLFLGSGDDNIRDKVNKGRGSHGARNSQAKLTEHQVLEIRASQLPGHILSKKYNTSESNISTIRNGVNWKHLKPEVVHATA